MAQTELVSLETFSFVTRPEVLPRMNRYLEFSLD